MKNKIILLSIMTALSTTSLASDTLESPSSYGYVQFNGGVASFKSGAGTFGGTSEGSEPMYGIEAGYKFDDYTRLSVSLDYIKDHSFSVPANENTSGTIDGVSYAMSSTNNFKVNSWVAMVNGYYDIKNSSPITPYFTIGLGASFNKAKSTYVAVDSFDGQIVANNSVSLAQASQDNFAYKAGFGVRYNVNNSFDIDLRYQFVDLGKFTTSSGAQLINGVSYPIAAQTVKLRSNQFLLGVAYKF